MTDFNRKSHKEWRKVVKKARRKRIRQQLAINRKEKEKEKEKSPSYLLELEKKRIFEEFELDRDLKKNEELNKKWMEEEERAQRKWREEQRLKELALEEKEKELSRIRSEWEKEQKRIREQKEKLEALKKEEERRQEETLKRINEFIYNGGDIPSELRVITESNPGKEICSFYQKVGVCRFGNQCSRNHYYYKISNVLLFSNFYSHFTLDQSRSSEYDTDINLEFEDSEMYHHFLEFYHDIVPELKKFGEVTMVIVCCNTEFHLRGNVYVEYKTEREAVVAYQKLQGRWYGGKQLQINFVKISDWGSAVCGDFVRKRCPKGKSCNFLHMFKNPRNEFSVDWHKKRSEDEYDRMRSSRSWRWSESPVPSQRKSKIKYTSEQKENNGREARSLEKRRRPKSRSRSRSSESKKMSCSSERRKRKSESPHKKLRYDKKRSSRKKHSSSEGS